MEPLMIALHLRKSTSAMSILTAASPMKRLRRGLYVRKWVCYKYMGRR